MDESTIDSSTTNAAWPAPPMNCVCVCVCVCGGGGGGGRGVSLCSSTICIFFVTASSIIMLKTIDHGQPEVACQLNYEGYNRYSMTSVV